MMSSFGPAGDSDFECEEEYDMFDALQPKQNVPINKTENSESVTVTDDPIIKQPISLNLQNMLRNAIVNSDLVIVKEIVMKSENPDVLLRCNWTPLMYACYFAQPDVVDVCIQQGADVNFTITDGSTPLLKACQSPRSEPDILTCIRLLINAGADILQCDCKGKTSLIYAAREGRLGIVRLLLLEVNDKVKIDFVNKKDKSFWNALDWAATNECTDIILELLSEGAVCNDCFSAEFWKDDVAKVIYEITAFKHTPAICDNNTTNQCVNPLTGIDSNKLDLASLKSVHNIDLPVFNKNDFSELSICKDISNLTAISNNKYFNPNSTNEKIEAKETVQQEEYVDDLFSGDKISENYVEYGQLELFLHGLDLPHLITLFQDQDIRFEQLLYLTMDDLILIGVKQLGARKRILDAIHQCHNEKWQSTSLPEYTTKVMTFENILSLVQNSSDHLKYISSSLRYVQQQIDIHPQVLTPSSREQLEIAPVPNLQKEVKDLLSSIHMLCKSTKSLQINLAMQDHREENVDMIVLKTNDDMEHMGKLFCISGFLVAITSLFIVNKFKYL